MTPRLLEIKRYRDPAEVWIEPIFTGYAVFGPADRVILGYAEQAEVASFLFADHAADAARRDVPPTSPEDR